MKEGRKEGRKKGRKGRNKRGERGEKNGRKGGKRKEIEFRTTSVNCVNTLYQVLVGSILHLI